jgi:hypothetical protein
MTTYLGLQRILVPSAQVNSLTTGSITLPSARQSMGSAFELIDKITITSTSTGVSFQNIPTNYQHLQLRITSITTRATYNYDSHRVTFNSNTSSIYDLRALNNDPANGSGLQSYASTGAYWQLPLAGTTIKNNMGYLILDIFDYTDTSKFTGIKFVGGSDSNGLDGGYRAYTLLGNGTWGSTDAVGTISISADVGPYTSQSTFSLYGWR